MEDLKIKISRSFSRKINLGNYETTDVYASYTEEVPKETSLEEQRELSRRLFNQAREDVEEQVKEIKIMNGYPKRQVVTDKTGDMKFVGLNDEKIKELQEKYKK